MKVASLLFVVVVLLISRSASAAGLPDWLLGEWVVTRVYQPSDEEIHYRNAEAEPVFRLTGKTMTVEANRLHLNDETCMDLTVLQKRDTVSDLIPGRDPAKLGLTPRQGRLPYFRINCGKSLIEDGDDVGERTNNSLYWIIVPNGRDKIEMVFFGACYLELRRKEKPLS